MPELWGSTMEKRKKPQETVKDARDILSDDILKYTFMIVPFKFQGAVDDGKIVGSDYFEKVDHKKLKYDRLYKHVAACIYEDNPDRSVYDYWVDREKCYPEVFRKVLDFDATTEGGQNFQAQGYLKDAFVYLFGDGIGFIVFNFVFDNATDVNCFCEIMNKLKKLKRDSSLFKVRRGEETVDIFGMAVDISQKLGLNLDLFFQHSSKDYVSAIMLNSFTHDEPQRQEDLLTQLARLKRSQGASYGTCDEAQGYLRPFENMYWAFSTQGVANVNCLDPKVGNDKFLKGFYDNVTREYLFMTLIVLNQEYTLLDYCQKFVSKSYEAPSVEELNRLYNFKIHNTYTTVSHLEHYRTFYSKFMEEMGVERILEEVDAKQESIRLTYKNRAEEEQRKLDEQQREKEEERAKRSKHLNDLIKVLSAMLSVFGIAELVSNIAYFLEVGTKWSLPVASIIFIVIGSVIGICILAVGIVMLISIIREKRALLREKKNKRKDK